MTAPTGWRVIDTAPTAGMPAIDEMGTITPTDQPAFVKVPFTLVKHGDIVPVSNELMKDNIAGLFNYLSSWFAKKLVNTENAALLGVMDDLTAVALDTSAPLAGLKTALNVTLDPAISAASVIITNQSGFNALDQLVDGNERPLLQPDPTNPTIYRVLGRLVRVMSDAQLPNVSGAAPFYIGDGTQYACLFTKEGFEFVSTDVGGNAFRTDSTEVRGVIRLGVSKFDTDAMVLRTLAI